MGEECENGDEVDEEVVSCLDLVEVVVFIFILRSESE